MGFSPAPLSHFKIDVNPQDLHPHLLQAPSIPPRDLISAVSSIENKRIQNAYLNSVQLRQQKSPRNPMVTKKMSITNKPTISYRNNKLFRGDL